MASVANDAGLRKEIHEEIAYGAKGLLAEQEPNGRWRQGVLDASHWLGTTCMLGGGLASAAAQLFGKCENIPWRSAPPGLVHRLISLSAFRPGSFLSVL